MMRGTIPRIAAVFSIFLLTACASTELINSWRDPEYNAQLRSLVVVGISKQASVRRVFEDAFAAQLRSKGIRAVPSYTLIVDDGPIAEDRLRAAVESADTDGVIITRLVKIENKVSVTYPGPPVAPFYAPYYYGYYTTAWVGYYEPPIVQQYDIVTAETTVFARGRAQPVWSGTTETFAPEDLAKETAGFAKVVMKALEKDGLIWTAQSTRSGGRRRALTIGGISKNLVCPSHGLFMSLIADSAAITHFKTAMT